MWDFETRDAAGVLTRLSEVPSLFAADRALVATIQGRTQLEGRPDVVFHRTRGFPWVLRPLEFLSVPRCLVVLKGPAALVALARDSGDCYSIGLYSFALTFLPAVVSHVTSGGSDPAEVAGQDATYCEVHLDGDSPGATGWLVLARSNRDCPADIVSCLAAVDDGS